MWGQCYERGIAALGYYYPRGSGKPIVGNCRNLTPDEYEEIWRKKLPYDTSSKLSLKRVGYEMKAHHVIFVKEGSFIVGKGTITRPYDWNPDIMAGTDAVWEHLVEVDWDNGFVPIEKVIGSEQRSTVIELSKSEVEAIEEEEEKAVRDSIKDRDYFEGDEYETESRFRKRNRALIEAKKANSNYECEVCGMRYEDVYGEIGREFIIAHHREPIHGGRRKSSLEDIALICWNCHAMLHCTNPPLTVEQLRNRLRMRYS